MFRIRAEFREETRIEAQLDRVRAFFSDLENFARLMPGVESIREKDGVALWTVSAEVALVGRLRGEFTLTRRDDSARRIEWGPAESERRNLLRYAISFEEQASAGTLVRMAERVELRRERATDLHLLAGLISTGRLNQGVEDRLALIMRTFLRLSRAELESL